MYGTVFVLYSVYKATQTSTHISLLRIFYQEESINGCLKNKKYETFIEDWHCVACALKLFLKDLRQL
jgi:hypothetical protein